MPSAASRPAKCTMSRSVSSKYGSTPIMRGRTNFIFSNTANISALTPVASNTSLRERRSRRLDADGVRLESVPAPTLDPDTEAPWRLVGCPGDGSWIPRGMLGSVTSSGRKNPSLVSPSRRSRMTRSGKKLSFCSRRMNRRRSTSGLVNLR